jgi:histidinol dehydrogenase
MPIRLSANDAGFGERFAAFLDTKREASADVESIVRKIIADVAERGDRALIEYSKQFDRVDLEKLGMKVKPAEINAALDATDRKRAPPSNSRATASNRTTGDNCRRTISIPMHSESNSARAGPRWKPPVFMCRAAPPLIRPRS